MVSHLHPLPGRPGSNCTKLHTQKKKAATAFRMKTFLLCQRDLYPFYLNSCSSAVKEEIHFHTCPSNQPFKRAGNLRGAHGGGESEEKSSEHHRCPRKTLQEGCKQRLIQDPAAPRSRPQQTDWPKLIQLSADSSRNITGSPAETNSGWGHYGPTSR